MLPRFVAGILASLAALTMSMPGFALDSPSRYQISAPLAHANLSVYLVRGQAAAAPVPLTLHEAMETGSAKLRLEPDGSYTLDNRSERAIFVPAGTLLVGGRQDQIVADSAFVPPGSADVLPSVFWGSARAHADDDPASFAVGSALLPSHMAELMMLPGCKDEFGLQQGRVWRSARSVLEGMSHRLGTAEASPRSATSLPIALDARIAQAQSRYLEAFARAAADADSIGAVFAVNGRLSGAEIFSSHELFQKMWPPLLRGYATEAMVEETIGTEPAPSIERVTTFLSAAERRRAQDPRLAGPGGPETRATGAALSLSRQADGSVVQRSYLSRVDAAELHGRLEGTTLQRWPTGISLLAFRSSTHVGFFQLADDHHHQLSTPAAPEAALSWQPMRDDQRGLLLAGLNVERRNINTASTFTDGSLWRGNISSSTLLLVGLLASLGVSLSGWALSRG